MERVEICTCVGCVQNYCCCKLKVAGSLSIGDALREKAKKCRCRSKKRLLPISFCRKLKRVQREDSPESSSNEESVGGS